MPENTSPRPQSRSPKSRGHGHGYKNVTMTMSTEVKELLDGLCSQERLNCSRGILVEAAISLISHYPDWWIRRALRGELLIEPEDVDRVTQLIAAKAKLPPVEPPESDLAELLREHEPTLRKLLDALEEKRGQ